MTRRALTLVAGTSAPSPLECIEIEWAKDVVDVRNLPGVRYNDHRSNYLLNFTAVHVPFRAAMKDFLKFKLTTDSWSYNEASNALVYLRASSRGSRPDIRSPSVSGSCQFRH
jgi:hypothetical protein